MGEAEIVATGADRPEVAALAESGQARASCAVAAAIAEEASSRDSSDDEGKAEADHFRRPIVKDTTRAHRNRPRANAVKKKKFKVSMPKSASDNKKPNENVGGKA